MKKIKTWVKSVLPPEDRNVGWIDMSNPAEQTKKVWENGTWAVVGQLSYDEGVIAGVSQQKAKLKETTVTSNDVLQDEDGYKKVTVNVDTTTPYNNGYSAGVAAQKAKLTSVSITENGTTTREDGYNSVTVNVPSIVPYGVISASDLANIEDYLDLSMDSYLSGDAQDLFWEKVKTTAALVNPNSSSANAATIVQINNANVASSIRQYTSGDFIYGPDFRGSIYKPASNDITPTYYYVYTTTAVPKTSFLPAYYTTN